MKQTLFTQIRRAALAASALALLAGCQGEFKEKSASQSMVPGTAYEVFASDSVVPSGTAQINVVHTLSNDVKIVTLVSGSATLLRGDYTLSR